MVAQLMVPVPVALGRHMNVPALSTENDVSRAASEKVVQSLLHSTVRCGLRM
jgi:hypothetical protein